jgi:DNA repair exonuclease SbcCD nuclease subunit
MFKFIHTADIHLDSPLHRLEYYEGAPVEEIRQASRRALENLIDLALNEPVDFILMAGDLFDGDWKDYNTGLYFISQMQRLRAAAIPVYIVAGNHDAAGRMTRSLPYPDNVHVFSHRKAQTLTLAQHQVAIHGHSFAAPAVADNLARRYPDPVANFFNIGLLHTSLNGREGHENYAPCSLDDLENRGYDYWALGHVHQFERVAEKPLVIFPGCLQGRNARETGTKGSVMVTVDEGQVLEVQRRPHDVIRWTHLPVTLTGPSTVQDSLAAFTRGLASLVTRHAPLPVIVRVVFSGQTEAHAEISGDLDYWKEVVRSTALAEFGERVWIERITLQTRSPENDGEVFADPGPLQELDRRVTHLLQDDQQLLAMGAALAPLFRKLPADYRQGDGALKLDQPDAWRRIAREARDLLVRGLKKEPPGP